MNKTSLHKSSQNTIFDRQPIKGIEATLADLIQARPAKGMTGFAPAGKVNTHQWGSYQSAFKGRGMEFAESRAYQEGDDVKYIDWRITARTGKAHTKLYQEERERPIHLLVDMRTMMQFGTRTRFKSNMVAKIAAQLAWVGFDGGDRVGGQLLTKQGIIDFRGARTRRAVLRLLSALSKETVFNPTNFNPTSFDPTRSNSGSFTTQRQTAISNNTFNDASFNSVDSVVGSNEASLAEGIYRLRKSARPGSLVFILSDFYDFDKRASQELIRLANHSHVTLIQVNDPMDKSLPSKAGQVSDGVASIDLKSLTQGQLDSYSQDYDTKQQLIYKVCAQHGIVLHELLTLDDPQSILHQSRRRASKTKPFNAAKPLKVKVEQTAMAKHDAMADNIGGSV